MWWLVPRRQTQVMNLRNCLLLWGLRWRCGPRSGGRRTTAVLEKCGCSFQSQGSKPIHLALCQASVQTICVTYFEAGKVMGVLCLMRTLSLVHNPQDELIRMTSKVAELFFFGSAALHFVCIMQGAPALDMIKSLLTLFQWTTAVRGKNTNVTPKGTEEAALHRRK